MKTPPPPKKNTYSSGTLTCCSPTQFALLKEVPHLLAAEEPQEDASLPVMGKLSRVVEDMVAHRRR